MSLIIKNEGRVAVRSALIGLTTDGVKVGQKEITEEIVVDFHSNLHVTLAFYSRTQHHTILLDKTILPFRQDWKFKRKRFENNSIVYTDMSKTSEGVKTGVCGSKHSSGLMSNINMVSIPSRNACSGTCDQSQDQSKHKFHCPIKQINRFIRKACSLLSGWNTVKTQ